jgi:hypothetical protein
MRYADDAILAYLRTPDILPPVGGEDRVHDGYVETDDPEGKIISATLPYLAYLSNLGDDTTRRLNGYNSRRSKFFQTTYVGDSREQAMLAGERIYAGMADKRIPGLPENAGKCILLDSQRIRRDDDAARPDGSPLFYGVSTWSIALPRRDGE